MKTEATMRDLCVLLVEVPCSHIYWDVKQISLYQIILPYVLCPFFNKLQILCANFMHGILFYIKI